MANIEIEKIKTELTNDLLPFLKELFPDNKIPLYLSPINDSNDNYLAWSAYSTVGPNSTYADNYCRTNDDSGRLYYPTDRDDLQSCDNFFTSDIKNLLNLNEGILTSINDVKLNDTIESKLTSDVTKANLEEKINEYSNIKKELLNQKKTVNNLDNISKIINDLNSKLNSEDIKTKNAVNINYDTIEQEKYKYLNTNYYIYTIIALTVIIFIIHFTVLYY